MRIAILNWSGGENDPFTYYSRQLQRQLVALGHSAQLLPLDESLGRVLLPQHRRAPYDLAFTWQGLGSAIRPAGESRTLWELLGIPLVCLQGDHPCYMPPNHEQSSRHLLHFYPCPSFARDANRLIPRDWPGIEFEPPNYVVDRPPPANYEGDYFVFPKNLQPVEELREQWRARYDTSWNALLAAGADEIIRAFHAGNRVHHQELILDLLPAPIPSQVRAGGADPAVAALVFELGRELDRVYRNTAAAFVIDTLAHVPIRVNGRGWERFAARGNPNHQFYPFGSVADGAAQFSSAYGILDVAPVRDLLHDRVWRAMRHGCGFLSGTAWREGEPIHDGFADLFFSGNADELASKAEQVMRDPAAHRQRTADFTTVYDAVFTFPDFVEQIRHHAAARGFVLP